MSTSEQQKEKQATDENQTHDYASLAKENEMQRVRIKQLETQLRQAIDIAQRVKQRDEARDEAAKHQLLTSIMQDSKYTREQLAVKSLDELQTIRTAIDNAIEREFANVAAQIDSQNTPRKPSLTVGEWKDGKWTGGLAE